MADGRWQFNHSASRSFIFGSSHFRRGSASGVTTAMFHHFQVAQDAKSGDGTVANVGIKLNGQCHCAECNQRFETDRALSLHVKFMHGNKVFRVLTLVQDGNAVVGSNLAGNEIFRVEEFSASEGDLKQQIADALQTNSVFLEMLQGGQMLDGKGSIDWSLGPLIVKQDMGRTADCMFD
jgi:hypothetical protein